jgi:hypothetical protein
MFDRWTAETVPPVISSSQSNGARKGGVENIEYNQFEFW